MDSNCRYKEETMGRIDKRFQLHVMDSPYHQHQLLLYE